MKNKTIGRVHPEYVGLFLADCEMRLNQAGIYRARILDADWHIDGSIEMLLLIIHCGENYKLNVDYGKGPDRIEVDLNYEQGCNTESLNLVSEILLSSHYLIELK